MKKVIFLIPFSILFLFSSKNTTAQWIGTSTTGTTSRTGNVGIGTTTPNTNTKLHVLSAINGGGSVLFNGETGVTPVSGYGGRFMWIPSKKAIRAGWVWGSQWDDVNIGDASFATGENNIASGSRSAAMGYDNTASGSAATVIGWGNVASGIGAFSGGLSCIASGQNSFAIGSNCQAINTSSFSMGSNNLSSGDNAFSIGNDNTASFDNSIVLGSNSKAQNQGSIAMGSFCESNGANAISFGTNSMANANNSFAMGLFTKANGNNSFAIGSGNYSPLSGGWTSLENNIDNSLMIGFNSNQPTLFVEGSSGAGKTGRVGIGTFSSLNGTLHIKKQAEWSGYALFSDSRVRPSPSTTCNWDNAAFIVNGDYTKGILVGRAIGECQEDGPWQETFHVYGNGWVEAAAYGVFSDKRFKKDIKTIENGLDVVKKLDGVSYKFNFDLATNPNADGKASYGFIAQEVEKIIPDAVLKNKEGFYSVNYDAIIPFLTNAIKEQQAQIEDLKKLIAQNSSNNSSTTGLGETNKPIDGYLAQNTPNPFSNNTEIKYQLPKGTQTAMLGIYDLNGSQVKMYSINAQNNSGSITVQAQELKAGMYIYTLVVNGKAFDSKKMVLTAQ